MSNSNLKIYLNKLAGKELFRDVFFWLVVYLYYLGTAWPSYDNKLALIEKLIVKTGFQVALTYTIILILIPHVLRKNRKLLFLIGSLLTVYLTYVSYTAYRHYFFDPKYPDIYRGFDFAERILDLNFFFTEITWFLFPAAILVALKYYRHQQEALNLREQKRITELTLLKNQLNPHFLFNTLNNLYTLALKKSDKTPEVIARLSAILDYMLHRGNAPIVDLTDEIQLLNNYIHLEKLRYGERVKIEFEYKTEKGVEIAPLILLTLLENAFKHGVKEEIGTATINMQLRATQKEIFFSINNSKPQSSSIKQVESTRAIGLQNIQQQLDLLYPNRNSFVVEEQANTHSVTLSLKSDAISMPDRR